MKVLSSSQFVFLTVFMLLSTKVLTIHPFVYTYAGKDSIWSIVFGMIFDLTILFLVIYIMQKNKNTTLFELLKKHFGTIIAKILLFLLFIFILLKTLFLYEETYALFLQILYDNLSIFIYLLPVAFITSYFAIKGIDTIVRSMEIFAVVVLVGIIVCGLTAINGTNPNNILPFFENGIAPSLNGFVMQFFYRGNPIILLCFMGKINFKKFFKLKVMLFSLALSLLIVGISLIFYMVYGPCAQYVKFTLADLPQYDPFVSDLGRFNWLSIVICTIAFFLTNGAFLYCLALLGRWILGLKRSFVPVCISQVIIIALAVINQFSLTIMMKKVTGQWMWISAIIFFIYLLLCLGLLFTRRQKCKKP